MKGTPLAHLNPKAQQRVFELRHEARPFTANQVRQWHFRAHAEHVAEWRHAFFILARQVKVPKMQRVALTVQAHLKGQRKVDTDSSAPTLKAALDGLVDAGVIPDDGPDYVAEVRYLAPVFGAERDAFCMRIEERP